MSEEMFLEIIADAGLDAHRRLQIIRGAGTIQRSSVLMGVPETHYLKCVVLRVVDCRLE